MWRFLFTIEDSRLPTPRVGTMRIGRMAMQKGRVLAMKRRILAQSRGIAPQNRRIAQQSRRIVMMNGVIAITRELSEPMNDGK